KNCLLLWDQNYTQKQSTIRNMKSIFIVYLFEVVDVNTYFVIVNLRKPKSIRFQDRGITIQPILHFPQQIRKHSSLSPTDS
ncbi:hypothetical protein ACJX0J_020380, partial [Zea mays]